MSLAGLNAAAPESSRRRSDAVAWLRVLFPELGLPVHSSDDDLRARLADGAVLCGVLRRLCPTLLSDEGRAAAAAGTVTDNNVGRFLAAVEKIGIQSFSPSDLEKGSMSSVVACLLALRDRFGTRVREDRSMSSLPRCESGGRNQLETKLQTMVTSPVMSEPSSPLSRSESSSPSLVFQPKQGGPGDLSGGKVSDIMRSTSLDNAPTQSILSVANSILDGSVERKNGEIPYRVACLLRKVILEIERRISTQAEHMRSQNNLIKAREEKYQSRIKVLEALASGATGQTQVASTYVQQKKMDKDKVEDKGKLVEEDMVWLMKYKEDVVRLTKEKEHMVRLLREKEDMIRLMNEKEDMVHLKKVIIDGRQTTNEDADRSIKEKDDIVVRLTKEKEEVVRLLKEKEDVIRLMKEKEEMVRLMKEKGDIASLKEGNVEDRKQSEDENADRLLKQKDDIVVRLTKEKEEMARLLKEKEDLIRLMEKEEMVRSTKQEAIASLKKGKVEDRKQSADEEADRAIKEKDDIVRLMKEKEDNGSTITKLRQELEAVQSSYEESCRLLESKKEDVVNLLTDKENGDTIILQLRQELEATKRLHETHSQQLEARVAQANMELEQRIKEIELMLEDSRKKRRELVELSESRIQIWKQKEATVNQFVGLQAQNVQDLRLSSVYVRHEILNCQKRWSEELAGLGQSLKVVTNAAENYHAALAENRKLFNEVQELKGNIRVYCRIRPFLPGEDQKSTSVEYIGDNGELVLANPTKQGKEGSKNFTFNKVFGPTTTQDDVFKDIQPLIRSVLDGYNVCIFAYGQTGAGKTYTMMGPENATEKEWGVNYRALNDLFNISNTRQDTITYELGVQMVEIYNEQIRDLLGSGGSQKKLGIQNTVQPNGLAVPDATMCPVSSTSHVIDLMQTGHNNRAMSATALNERSSRSHSVVTIHVRGQDLKTGATLRGSLHLVDLAGSERVDRSAVTGDRLREAQHINKSLSALGDVIFSLSQKNAHVPYRNSKLTQVLQTSLGGHAKTLMFVQVNPDVTSYTETLSTLKFAERVSGVELGVARTNKEGKDVKELMEQLSLLKDTIAKKDEEIDQLQLLNTHSPRSKSVKHAESLKHSSSSPGMSSLGKVASIGSGARSDLNDFSDSDRHSEAGSMMSADDIQQQREAMKLSAGETDPELPGDADSEGRLSDVSDGGFSAGVETDGPVSSVVEPEQERTPGAGTLPIKMNQTSTPEQQEELGLDVLVQGAEELMELREERSELPTRRPEEGEGEGKEADCEQRRVHFLLSLQMKSPLLVAVGC